LRRTIGLKKDEYSLDRKTVTKADVMNLLQAAGFSRSNPYYIVPQGRITALTNARDEERLELLKEVAGTRVYEDHRQESLKILEETALKQEKIRELLGFIDERLGELAEEKEELLRFQELDRKKRATEALLIAREQGEVEEALAKLESERPGEESFQSENGDFERQLDAIGQVERELGNQRQILAEAEREADSSRADVEELQKLKAQLTVAVADWSEEAGKYDSDIASARTSLTRVERDIERKEAEMAQLIPRLNELQSEMAALRTDEAKCTAEEGALKSRQGRFSQFTSTAERDTWIKAQLATLEQTAHLLRDQAAAADSSLAEAQGVVDEMQRGVADLQKTATEAAAGRDGLEVAVLEAKKARDIATDARKDLWRAEGKVNSALAAINEQVQSAERTLASCLDRSTWAGLEALKGVLASGSSNEFSANVLGPLYELISVPDSLFRPAVEAIAGGTLFNVVTRDDRTATHLLQALPSVRAARLTCIPMNRISGDVCALEDEVEEDSPAGSAANLNGLPADCIRLLDKIELADSSIAAVVKSIFGRAVVVPGLSDRELLKELRARGLTAITLDGDRVDRRGAIFFGGAAGRSNEGASKSRLEAASRLMTWRRKEAEQRSLLADLQSRLALADQHMTRTVADLVALEQQRALSSPERIIATLEARRSEFEAAKQLLARRIESRAALEAQLQGALVEITQLAAEMHQPLKALSATERAQLNSLSASLEAIKSQISTLSATLAQITSRQSQLEAVLEENLRRRRLELLSKLAGMAPRANGANQKQEQLQACLSTLAEAQKRLADAVQVKEQATNQIASLENSLEKARAASDALIKNAAVQGSSLERYLSRRSLLLQRHAEAGKRLRELGLIAGDPEVEAVAARLRDLSTPSLIATLADAIAALKAAFGSTTRPPPNRKAVELHASFTKQAEGLQARERELDASARSITDFISLLDQRKDEAIMRTFEQVKENFSRVFERLCPAGHAQLVMIRVEAEDLHETENELANGVKRSKSRRKSGVSADAASSTANAANSASTFFGVGIKASFASKSASEGLLIGQLSGGQKSLLALALIFAIQLVDPAPFYLFDEIDANLDAAARTAVADLIFALADPVQAGAVGGSNARAAPPAQFITTTFRPELLKHADSFFGVSFAGRVSKVEQITSEQAMQFIEHSSI
jgi:structural maintenance of chromosome 3 (chondroitin sulfate proteoglycan 6)